MRRSYMGTKLFTADRHCCSLASLALTWMITVPFRPLIPHCTFPVSFVFALSFATSLVTLQTSTASYHAATSSNKPQVNRKDLFHLSLWSGIAAFEPPGMTPKTHEQAHRSNRTIAKNRQQLGVSTTSLKFLPCEHGRRVRPLSLPFPPLPLPSFPLPLPPFSPLNFLALATRFQ